MSTPGEASAEIRHTDRRQNAFLARLVHELRNPLAPIRMALQIMQLSDDDVATTRAARVIIDRQLKQLTRLIDDLGDITQLDTASLHLNRQPTTLSAVLQAAMEMVRSQLESRQNALRTELVNEQQPIYADATRLAQAVANLIVNASKYSALAAPIGISAIASDSQIQITVTDSGVGIPDAMLLRIFEPFVQVDSSGLGTHDGLGIGLTLVKNVAEAHGGTAWAESGATGGSRFFIRLPQSAAQRATPAVASRAPQADSPKLRILVADDNRDAAQTLAIMLRLEGHEVRTSHDGLEALAIGQLMMPELVFLDIGMPVMDGYQTARQMREREWGRHAYLVALTGWGQETDRRSALASGFQDHVVKPAAPDRLKAIIESAQLALARPAD